MSNYPVKLGKRALRDVEQDALEVIEPAASANAFLSFRYLYTEISALGGKTHVKSRKTRYEDGKLTSEAFEGELDRSAYEQMVGQAQRYVLGQTELFLKAFASLLPLSQKKPSNRD
jgi:hypothetical protein